jgi:hypothetical protein
MHCDNSNALTTPSEGTWFDTQLEGYLNLGNAHFFPNPSDSSLIYYPTIWHYTDQQLTVS